MVNYLRDESLICCYILGLSSLLILCCLGQWCSEGAPAPRHRGDAKLMTKKIISKSPLAGLNMESIRDGLCAYRN